MLSTLSKKNFQTTIATSKNLSLVQFKTEWSGSCQILDPVYRELAKSYRGQVDFFQIDADAEKDLSNQYGISEWPTILFFKNGDLVDHVAGLIARNKLISKIENALSLSN